MNGLYILGGFVCLGLGSFITIIQIKKIMAGKADQMGFDYRLLAGGIIFIMVGISLIDKYI